jgi:hypothetical protein
MGNTNVPTKENQRKIKGKSKENQRYFIGCILSIPGVTEIVF